MKYLRPRHVFSASLKSDERGFSLLLILVIVAVVGAATAGGLTTYLLLREEVSPSEQTSKFLPADTQIYFSLNLRPGNDQLKKFRDIFARFREHPNFQSKIDELLDDAMVETGMDLVEDVIPWLGPELAIAFVDVVGSAVGAATGGAPLAVAMLGTSDSVPALSVIQDWTRYLTQEEGLKFATETYEGLTVFSEQDDEQHYVVMEDYVLFATDRELLEDEFGLQGDQVSYGGGAGVVFDLRELTGSAVYRPGYLILGVHLIISTNADTLELVASIIQGQSDSLATKPEYSRVLGEVTGTGNSLIYVNIGEITKGAVAALDPEDRSEYQKSVEPFVGPL